MKMGWIKVEESLPEERKRVLGYAGLYDNSSHIDCSYFECHHYGGRWIEEIDGLVIHVTHWMPLPKPPHEQ